MNLVKWNKLYSTGIEQIDRHNFHLFELLYHAHLRLSKKAGIKPKRIDLEEIVRYAQFHFAREEVWMAHTHYPVLPAHEEEHKLIRQSLTNISIEQNPTSTLESLGLVIDTFLHHIKNSDSDYGRSESAIRLSSYLKSNKTPPR